MSAPYDIEAVEYLDGYRLNLRFADGLVRDVDLAALLDGDLGPVFEPLRDVEFFARVAVDPDIGTIVWPNGADLAPDVLHEQAITVGSP